MKIKNKGTDIGMASPAGDQQLAEVFPGPRGPGHEQCRPEGYGGDAAAKKS